jgi:hypothetical protein
MPLALKLLQALVKKDISVIILWGSNLKWVKIQYGGQKPEVVLILQRLQLAMRFQRIHLQFQGMQPTFMFAVAEHVHYFIVVFLKYEHCLYLNDKITTNSYQHGFITTLRLPSLHWCIRKAQVTVIDNRKISIFHHFYEIDSLSLVQSSVNLQFSSACSHYSWYCKSTTQTVWISWPQTNSWHFEHRLWPLMSFVRRQR